MVRDSEVGTMERPMSHRMPQEHHIVEGNWGLQDRKGERTAEGEGDWTYDRQTRDCFPPFPTAAKALLICLESHAGRQTEPSKGVMGYAPFCS